MKLPRQIERLGVNLQASLGYRKHMHIATAELLTFFRGIYIERFGASIRPSYHLRFHSMSQLVQKRIQDFQQHQITHHLLLVRSVRRFCRHPCVHSHLEIVEYMVHTECPHGTLHLITRFLVLRQIKYIFQVGLHLTE
jgi:hypothetical protein